MRFRTLASTSLLLLPVSVLCSPPEEPEKSGEHIVLVVEKRADANFEKADYKKGDLVTESYKKLTNHNSYLDEEKQTSEGGPDERPPGKAFGDGKTGPVNKGISHPVAHSSLDTTAGAFETTPETAWAFVSCDGCLDDFINWLDTNRASLDNLTPWQKANVTNWAREVAFFSTLINNEIPAGADIPPVLKAVPLATHLDFTASGTSGSKSSGTRGATTGNGSGNPTSRTEAVGAGRGAGSRIGGFISSLLENTLLGGGSATTRPKIQTKSGSNGAGSTGQKLASTRVELRTEASALTSGIQQKIAVPMSTVMPSIALAALYSVSYFSTSATMTLTEISYSYPTTWNGNLDLTLGSAPSSVITTAPTSTMIIKESRDTSTSNTFTKTASDSNFALSGINLNFFFPVSTSTKDSFSSSATGTIAGGLATSKVTKTPSASTKNIESSSIRLFRPSLDVHGHLLTSTTVRPAPVVFRNNGTITLTVIEEPTTTNLASTKATNIFTGLRTSSRAKSFISSLISKINLITTTKSGPTQTQTSTSDTTTWVTKTPDPGSTSAITSATSTPLITATPGTSNTLVGSLSSLVPLNPEPGGSDTLTLVTQTITDDSTYIDATTTSIMTGDITLTRLNRLQGLIKTQAQVAATENQLPVDTSSKPTQTSKPNATKKVTYIESSTSIVTSGTTISLPKTTYTLASGNTYAMVTTKIEPAAFSLKLFGAIAEVTVSTSHVRVSTKLPASTHTSSLAHAQSHKTTSSGAATINGLNGAILNGSPGHSHPEAFLISGTSTVSTSTTSHIDTITSEVFFATSRMNAFGAGRTRTKDITKSTTQTVEVEVLESGTMIITSHSTSHRHKSSTIHASETTHHSGKHSTATSLRTTTENLPETTASITIEITSRETDTKPVETTGPVVFSTRRSGTFKSTAGTSTSHHTSFTTVFRWKNTKSGSSRSRKKTSTSSKGNLWKRASRTEAVEAMETDTTLTTKANSRYRREQKGVNSHHGSHGIMNPEYMLNQTVPASTWSELIEPTQSSSGGYKRYKDWNSARETGMPVSGTRNRSLWFDTAGLEQ